MDQAIAYRFVNKYYYKLASEMPDLLAALVAFIPPQSMQDIYRSNRVMQNVNSGCRCTDPAVKCPIHA